MPNTVIFKNRSQIKFAGNSEVEVKSQTRAIISDVGKMTFFEMFLILHKSKV